MRKRKTKRIYDPEARLAAARHKTLQSYTKWQKQELPALAYEVCLYLADNFCNSDRRRISFMLDALSHWHKENGFPDPTACPSVTDLVRQIWDRMPLPSVPAFQRPPSITDVMYLAEACKHHRASPTSSSDADSRKDLAKPISKTELIAFRNRAILLIAFWFGLTTSEACSLTKKDIKITGNTLGVTTDRPGENGVRARYTFEISRLPVLCPLEALEDWLAHSKNTTHYLFPHITKLARSVPVGAPVVHQELKKMVAKNGREKINTRSFRYGLYFFFVKNGWPAKKILKHLPFYQKNSVDSRIRRTQRVRYCDLPVLSKEEISKIKSAFSQSHYYAA